MVTGISHLTMTIIKLFCRYEPDGVSAFSDFCRWLNILPNTPFFIMWLPWLFRPSRDFGKIFGYSNAINILSLTGHLSCMFHKFI